MYLTVCVSQRVCVCITLYVYLNVYGSQCVYLTVYISLCVYPILSIWLLVASHDGFPVGGRAMEPCIPRVPSQVPPEEPEDKMESQRSLGGASRTVPSTCRDCMTAAAPLPRKVVWKWRIGSSAASSLCFSSGLSHPGRIDMLITHTARMH